MMTGFPYDGTWGLGARGALAATDISHTAGDGGTKRDSKCLVASKASGTDGIARAAELQRLSYGEESIGASLKGVHSGANVNGTR